MMTASSPPPLMPTPLPSAMGNSRRVAGSCGGSYSGGGGGGGGGGGEGSRSSPGVECVSPAAVQFRRDGGDDDANASRVSLGWVGWGWVGLGGVGLGWVGLAFLFFSLCVSRSSVLFLGVCGGGMVFALYSIARTTLLAHRCLLHILHCLYLLFFTCITFFFIRVWFCMACVVFCFVFFFPRGVKAGVGCGLLLTPNSWYTSIDVIFPYTSPPPPPSCAPACHSLVELDCVSPR